MQTKEEVAGLVFNHLIQNGLTQRSQLLQALCGTQRNIDSEAGHPFTISPADYKREFERGDVATRVVSIYPDESWNQTPDIYETEDAEEETEFEERWKVLEEAHNCLSELKILDTVCGIGQYGVLLIGLNDNQPLNSPASGINEKGIIEPVPREGAGILYLRAFDETQARIKELEKDSKNPRYGLPKFYEIDFSDTDFVPTGLDPGGNATSTNSIVKETVHWSRCIHLIDNRTTSRIFGRPRLKNVYNRILDLKKIHGGSGEMFWKGGFPGYSMEAIPIGDQFPKLNIESIKEQFDGYMEGLQRYMAVSGVTIKSLGLQIADPRPAVEVQLRAIATGIGVPWRKFMGSEQAQLASEQDTNSWNETIMERRRTFVSPFIIRQFLNRLIAFGVLPQPKELIIDWPDKHTPSEQEKALVSKTKTEAMAAYVSGNVVELIPPQMFLTTVMDFTDEEAEQATEEAEVLAEDRQEQETVMLEQQARLAADNMRSRNGNGAPARPAPARA